VKLLAVLGVLSLALGERVASPNIEWRVHGLRDFGHHCPHNGVP